jgi:transcriptional regulator with XRE-family HTH domain
VQKKRTGLLHCDIRTSFAKAFDAWRKKNNLPLKDVAAGLGVSLATVNAWERGEKFPTAQHFQALVNYTGIPPCRLFCVMADKCVPTECLLAMPKPSA